MTITRDAEFPVEIAQLMAAFNRCADGYAAETVLNASLQMLIAAIVYVARENGCSSEHAAAAAVRAGTVILAGVAENWERAAKPTDVVVKPS